MQGKSAPKQKNHIISAATLYMVQSEILTALQNAEIRFPLWPEDPMHGIGIMAEESGEAVKATLDWTYGRNGPEQVKKELRHTAAMCIRMLAWLERKSDANI